MKKATTKSEGEMRPEYDFCEGVRGKYASAYSAGTKLVRLDPEISEAFPDSESVNDALRSVLPVAKRARKVS